MSYTFWMKCNKVPHLGDLGDKKQQQEIMLKHLDMNREDSKYHCCQMYLAGGAQL
jgi:hypothetical protein